jgi:hypothetical protein
MGLVQGGGGAGGGATSSGASGAIQTSNGAGGFSAQTNVAAAADAVAIGATTPTGSGLRLANDYAVLSRTTTAVAIKLARLNASNEAIIGDDVSGFSYWLLNQVSGNAELKVWNGSSFVTQLKADGSLMYAGVPIIGNSQPFGVHGLTTKAMADANQTLLAGDYSRKHIEFTGALTASRTMTFPHPSSADRSYSAYIHHNGTGNVIVISTGTGTTITMAAGNRAVLGFRPAGVYSIASFTVA